MLSVLSIVTYDKLLQLLLIFTSGITKSFGNCLVQPLRIYNPSILLTTTAGHSTTLRLHQHPLRHGLDITGHSIRKALSSIYFAVGIAKGEDHKLMTDIIKKISIQSKCFHFSVCLFLFYVYECFAFMYRCVPDVCTAH